MDAFNAVNGVDKLNDGGGCDRSYLPTIHNRKLGNNKEMKDQGGESHVFFENPRSKRIAEHICEAKTPKEAWEVFASLFCKKNDARLRNYSRMIQGSMSISQFFLKVKGICHEISQLDVASKISCARRRRILICRLSSDYNGFTTAIQGWTTQASILELESLLPNQETLQNKWQASLCKPTFSKNSIKLEDVYHVPDMKKNLMSVSQLAATGTYVVFGSDDV